MDITELPEHILNDIAKYLSTDDLLSCSLVNVNWRNCFNSNCIWKYVCKNCVVSNTGEELDYIPNLVPHFEVPYSAPDFDDLCKWRKTFMRWSRLKENWLKGCFTRYSICEPVSTFCTIECDDNVAMIVYNDLREISVWNIKLVPYHQEIIKFCLNHVCSEFVKLCNNYLIVVQCNLLQVFRGTENGFELHFRSIFDKNETYSKQLPSNHDISGWYCSNIDLYPCDITLQCEHNGHKFIGMILDSNSSDNVLHIWDLNKKEKDIELLVPQTSDIISHVNFTVSDVYLFLMITNFNLNCNYNSLHVYDLNEFKFLDFSVRFTYVVPAFVVSKDIIIAVDDRQRNINVWKVRSKSNTIIECNFDIELKCFNVESSYLLVGGRCSSSSSTICVYKLNNVELVFTKNVLFVVSFISLVHSRFLILGSVSSLHFCSVMDMTKDCILYNIDEEDCVFVNSIHSKLLTRIDNQLSILSFW